MRTRKKEHEVHGNALRYTANCSQARPAHPPPFRALLLAVHSLTPLLQTLWHAITPFRALRCASLALFNAIAPPPLARDRCVKQHLAYRL